MQSKSSSFESPVNTHVATTPATLVERPESTSYFPPTNPTSTLHRIRQVVREPLAEFFGVAIFVIFGTGVNCQTTFSTNKAIVSSTRGDFLSVNFGWAVGLAMGAWISGGISGGHLNPAVTLAMATWRGFSWRKVPAYIFSQVMGGVVGAALVYGNYHQAIDIFEGGLGSRTTATASLFATYPLEYLSTGACFFSEFLGTFVLVFMVVAATDKYNNAPPSGLLPLTLFLALLGLGIGLGMQTSYAFNPARDFGPRLLLTIAGYGKQLYTFRQQYWLWCPIIAPVLGAQTAVGLYDLFLNKNCPLSCNDTPQKEKIASDCSQV